MEWPSKDSLGSEQTHQSVSKPSITRTSQIGMSGFQSSNCSWPDWPAIWNPPFFRNRRTSASLRSRLPIERKTRTGELGLDSLTKSWVKHIGTLLRHFSGPKAGGGQRIRGRGYVRFRKLSSTRTRYI